MADLIIMITQAWLLAMVKGGFPVEPLIDPEQGLVVLEHMTDSPSEDYEGIVDCHNKPGPPFCRFFYAYEYTSTTNLVMRKTDDGRLALDAIMYLDGGSMVEGAYAVQSKWAAKQMTKLRSTNCAGDTQTPPPYKHVANP